MVEDISENESIDTPKLNKSVERTMVEEAQEAAKQMREANAEMRALLERQDKLRATELLGGKSEAGQPTPEPIPETPQEYARRILSGKK